MPYTSTLEVFIAWHPRFERGAELANRLYAHVSRDPERATVRGVGVPVRFRSTPADETSPLPRTVLLENVAQAAVVVLVDDEMVADPAWGGWVADLWERARDPQGPYRLFPVALSENAYNLHQSVAATNFLRLQEYQPEDQSALLVNRVTHELCRLLFNKPRAGAGGEESGGRRPVRVFLSHAKADGLDLAKGLQDHIRGATQTDTFFDARDIPYGEDFRKVLDEGLRDSALLAILTDAYSTREWCRYEVLAAKRMGVPMVVIDAVSRGEQRAFPYLGNVPTVRWPVAGPRPYETVLGLLLQEVLRRTYFLLHCETLRSLYGVPKEVEPMSYPPELLTALELRTKKATAARWIYPDPPLGTQETELLREFDPDLQFLTPTLLPVLYGSKSHG